MVIKTESPLVFRCPVQQHQNKRGYQQTHINFGVDFCELFDVQKGDVILLRYDTAQQALLMDIERPGAANADPAEMDTPDL